MKHSVFFCLTVLLMLGHSSPGFCEESNKEEQIFTIQNKVFQKYHELDLSLGYIADDDFHNVFPFGLSYTYSFNERFSWEVARFQIAINKEKSLKKDLEKDFGVTPSQFTEPNHFIHSSLIYRPFYGKDSFLNRGIINREGYLLIGAGMVNFEQKKSFGPSSKDNAGSVIVGFGTKYFLSENICVNLDFRDMLNFKKDKTENYIFLGFSIGYRFNLSPREIEKDKTIERLKDYVD